MWRVARGSWRVEGVKGTGAVEVTGGGEGGGGGGGWQGVDGQSL
jgi:hypothetical protein